MATAQEDDGSPADAMVWVETCEDCETAGYNCPMHDGPEWDDE